MKLPQIEGAGEILGGFNPDGLAEVYEKGFTIVSGALTESFIEALRKDFGATLLVDGEFVRKYGALGVDYTYRYANHYHTSGTQHRHPALSALFEGTREAIQCTGRVAGDPFIAAWGGNGIVSSRQFWLPSGRNRSTRHMLRSMHNRYPEGHRIPVHNDGDNNVDLLVLYGVLGRRGVKLQPGVAKEVVKLPGYPQYQFELECDQALVMAGEMRSEESQVSLPAHSVANIGKGPLKTISIDSRLVRI